MKNLSGNRVVIFLEPMQRILEHLMETVKRKTSSAACIRQKCEGCEIDGKLLCIHSFKDLIDFMVLFIGWAIPFFSGMVKRKGVLAPVSCQLGSSEDTQDQI